MPRIAFVRPLVSAVASVLACALLVHASTSFPVTAAPAASPAAATVA